MREIKFRGKYYRPKNALYKKEDRWVYGSLVINNDIGTYWIKDGDHTYLVAPKSVGQYTGLKDKNGKEIYEGDIVQESIDYEIGQVVFRQGHYTVDWHDEDMWHDLLYNYTLEIIGNIYENPELLSK